MWFLDWRGCIEQGGYIRFLWILSGFFYLLKRRDTLLKRFYDLRKWNWKNFTQICCSYNRGWSSRRKPLQPARKAEGSAFKDIKDQYLQSGQLFEDPDFPAQDTSIFYSRGPPKPFEWRRPSVRFSADYLMLSLSLNPFPQKRRNGFWIGQILEYSVKKNWQKTVDHNLTFLKLRLCNSLLKLMLMRRKLPF